tara:strand:+ start:215 stop:475 length:261 start_codon:yes stop_codon:yes gene_type:complete
MKKDVTFIKDLVEVEVNKNPNGLVSKQLAKKLENYLKKFINTKGATSKSIISNLIEIQFNNKPYKLTTLYSAMFTLSEFSNPNIKL